MSTEPIRVLIADDQSITRAGLRQLLQSREGLRRAMILQEVLGPPVARRRPMRPPPGAA